MAPRLALLLAAALWPGRALAAASFEVRRSSCSRPAEAVRTPGAGAGASAVLAHPSLTGLRLAAESLEEAQGEGQLRGLFDGAAHAGAPAAVPGAAPAVRTAPESRPAAGDFRSRTGAHVSPPAPRPSRKDAALLRRTRGLRNALSAPLDAVLDTVNPFQLYINKILGLSYRSLAPPGFFEDGSEVVLGVNAVGRGELYRVAADYMTGASVADGKRVLQRHVNSARELRSTLLAAYQESGPIGKLVLAAHGSPARLSIGGTSVDVGSAFLGPERLPYDLFAPGAQIALIACETAHGSLSSPGTAAQALVDAFVQVVRQGGTLRVATRYVDPEYSRIPMEYKSVSERIVRHLLSPVIAVFETLQWLGADWTSRTHKIVDLTLPPQPRAGG